MGVIYKLTDDVVAFILDEKKRAADLSCRELVVLVESKFGRNVSKSSVHEVLKAANIVSPRGRKIKNKFQIPEDKKAQLMASLPPAIVATIPGLPVIIEPEHAKEIALPSDLVLESDVQDDADEQPLKLRVEPMVLSMPQTTFNKIDVDAFALLPLEEDGESIKVKDMFIQAAFYDLFPSPWTVDSVQGLNALDAVTVEKEASYRLLGVANFRVELTDGSYVYIDARMQRLGGEFIADACLLPIESAVLRMADQLLNNIQPLIIREISADFFDAAVYDMLRSAANVSNKEIARISLLDNNSEPLIEFENIPRIKRNFIMGINPNNKDMQAVQIQEDGIQKAASYVNDGPISFVSQAVVVGDSAYRGIVILGDDKQPRIWLMSNLSQRVTDQDIITQYTQKHPRDYFLKAPLQNAASAANFCLKHAQYLFGDMILDENAHMLEALQVKKQYNAAISIANITIPSTYKHQEALSHMCATLNSLNITDRQGRKIWAKTA